MTSLSDHHLQQRRAIRQRMRERRRSLSPGQQADAAARLTRHLQQQLWFTRARRIGFYLASDGELDVTPALLANFQRGHQLFLPVLDHKRMHFRPWVPGAPLKDNHFGIPEPQGQVNAPAWSLDVLLMPLVAFDARGNRLGMGGGFYDRTLASFDRAPRRPRLVGVGYRFQEVDALPVAQWDRPLDEVVCD